MFRNMPHKDKIVCYSKSPWAPYDWSVKMINLAWNLRQPTVLWFTNIRGNIFICMYLKIWSKAKKKNQNAGLEYMGGPPALPCVGTDLDSPHYLRLLLTHQFKGLDSRSFTKNSIPKIYFQIPVYLFHFTTQWPCCLLFHFPHLSLPSYFMFLGLINISSPHQNATFSIMLSFLSLKISALWTPFAYYHCLLRYCYFDILPI